MRTEKVLVTGATGALGRELVPLLVGAGVEVKAGTRHPERAKALFDGAVEVVELAYHRTETFDAALTWADRVLLMPPPFSPDALDAIAPFLDWAVSTRVRHVALVSAMAVADVDDLALRAMEVHLERQDTAHTILRPNLYMQNFHPGFIGRMVREEGRIRLPAGEARVSFVDVRDVAEVAARVLTSEDHFGRAITLTGPEALSIAEAADLIAEAAGRAVPYEAVGDDEFRAFLEGESLRPAEIDVLLALFGSIRNGWRAPVHPQVERLIGRAPRTFAGFAREHRKAWV